MSAIKFVYFDLGNVLVSFDPAIACANVADLFGISTELAEEIIYTSELEPQLERGEITPDAFADEVKRRVACCNATHSDNDSPPRGNSAAFGDGGGIAGNVSTVSSADLLDAVSDMFTPILSMRHAMDLIRASAIRIGILSNTCEPHWDWIARQSYGVLDGHFDAQVLSCRVGAMKPDAAIYEAAEQHARVEPQEILFLDDKPENIHTARSRGWKGEVCLGGEAAFTALRRHGLVA